MIRRRVLIITTCFYPFAWDEEGWVLTRTASMTNGKFLFKTRPDSEYSPSPPIAIPIHPTTRLLHQISAKGCVSTDWPETYQRRSVGGGGARSVLEKNQVNEYEILRFYIHLLIFIIGHRGKATDYNDNGGEQDREQERGRSY